MSNILAWICITILIRVIRTCFELTTAQVLGKDLMSFWLSVGFVCIILDVFRAYKYFSETK